MSEDRKKENSKWRPVFFHSDTILLMLLVLNTSLSFSSSWLENLFEPQYLVSKKSVCSSLKMLVMRSTLSTTANSVHSGFGALEEGEWQQEGDYEQRQAKPVLQDESQIESSKKLNFPSFKFCNQYPLFPTMAKTSGIQAPPFIDENLLCRYLCESLRACIFQC